MRYTEEKRNLFSVNNDYTDKNWCLAHCISADFGMFAGVAVGFNQNWNMKQVLLSTHKNVQINFRKDGGLIIPVNVKDYGKMTVVYNLITKEVISDYPTYASLEKCLECMKEDMVLNNRKYLAIPKIGCGIDGLDWNIVSSKIKEIFNDTDIEILVCYL